MITCEKCESDQFIKLSSDPLIEVPIGSESIHIEPVWIMESYICVDCDEQLIITKEPQRED